GGGGVRIFYGEVLPLSLGDRLSWFPGFFEYRLISSKYPYSEGNSPYSDGKSHRCLGFEYYSRDYSPKRHIEHATNYHIKSITFPHAALLFILALYPLRFAWRIRRKRKRAKLGLCARCGYDLRASQGPCSECGHALDPFV